MAEQSLTMLIAALPASDLDGLYESFSTGVSLYQRQGYPRMAAWYQALAAMLASERALRDGTEAAPDGEGRLLRCIRTLSDRELAALAVGILAELGGVPCSPLGDVLAAILGRLKSAYYGRVLPA